MTHLMVALAILVLFSALGALLIIKGVSHHMPPSRLSSDTEIIERAIIDKAERMCRIAEERSPAPPPILDIESELLEDEKRRNPLSDSATQKTIHLKAEQIRRLSDAG